MMDRCQSLDRLHFDNDRVFDHEIDTIPCIQRNAIIDDR